jgi:hypothetical protein
VKDLTPGFSCDSTAFVGAEITSVASPSSSASLSPSPSFKGVMYDPTVTASVEWAENGYDLNVVGPYPALVLERLAEGITWTSSGVQPTGS